MDDSHNTNNTEPENSFHQAPAPNYPNQGGYQNLPNPASSEKPPVNHLAVTSLVLGIASILISCCCFPIGFIAGFAMAMTGLVLAIVSKKGQPFSGFAIAGLVFSILGICFSLVVFGCYLLTAYMMSDPNYAAFINEFIQQYENTLIP